MRALLADLADLLLPGSCAGCEAPGRSPCARCSAALRGPVSRVPGFELPALESPGWCWSGGVYEGALRGLLLAYKEHKQHALADPLGVLLARVVVAGLGADPWPPGASAEWVGRSGPGGSGGVGGRAGRPVCLVPVPSGAAVARARGGQHVHRVAVAAARELRRAGLRARASPALRVVAARRDSAGLTVAERAENVRGAFAVRAFWRRAGGLAVLVDDLVTTGSTLAEAGRVLAAAGVPPSFAATLAATPRRLPRRRCQPTPGRGEAGSL